MSDASAQPNKLPAALTASAYQHPDTPSTPIGESDLLARCRQLEARNVELEHQNQIGATTSLELRQALRTLQALTQHPLQQVFNDGVQQAAGGKGNERHGDGKAFDEQPWVDLAEAFGSGFLFGQAAKKLREAQKLPTHEARRHERLGAINYIAMGILFEDWANNPATDHD